MTSSKNKVAPRGCQGRSINFRIAGRNSYDTASICANVLGHGFHPSTTMVARESTLLIVFFSVFSFKNTKVPCHLKSCLCVWVALPRYLSLDKSLIHPPDNQSLARESLSGSPHQTSREAPHEPHPRGPHKLCFGFSGQAPLVAKVSIDPLQQDAAHGVNRGFHLETRGDPLQGGPPRLFFFTWTSFLANE